MPNMKDTCAIVGIGETKFGALPGVSHYALFIDAAKKAIEDAGLTSKDVDGLLVLNLHAIRNVGSALVLGKRWV